MKKLKTKLQYKSKSAKGEYWYDVPKGKHINNARFLLSYELREVTVTDNKAEVVL